MTQREKTEEFWASGLIKYTIEEWEDAEKMDGEQILDFIKSNVDELTAFISSEASKQRFFLTIIKICSMRDVSTLKFEEILECFDGRKCLLFRQNNWNYETESETIFTEGSKPNQITEPEIRKFIELYKGYKA